MLHIESIMCCYYFTSCMTNIRNSLIMYGFLIRGERWESGIVPYTASSNINWLTVWENSVWTNLAIFILEFNIMLYPQLHYEKCHSVIILIITPIIITSRDNTTCILFAWMSDLFIYSAQKILENCYIRVRKLFFLKSSNLGNYSSSHDCCTKVHDSVWYIIYLISTL